MINSILFKLSKSKFRSSFKLRSKDIEYINKVGLDKIKSHTYNFVSKRLKDVSKVNDGKQTPTHGHPVFIAQHATATCCRGCLEKWHKIDKNKILDNKDIDYIVSVIMTWINMEYHNFDKNNNI